MKRRRRTMGRLSNPREAKWVVCPYYHGSDALTIMCDGICGAATMQLRYTDPDAKRRHLGRMCCSIRGMDHCPIKRWLDALNGADNDINPASGEASDGLSRARETGPGVTRGARIEGQ